jgi:hypothetical protein
MQARRLERKRQKQVGIEDRVAEIEELDPRVLVHKRIYRPKGRGNEKRRFAMREKRAERFGERAWMKWRAYCGRRLCREYV